MKRLLVVGSLCVVLSLLFIPLSSAVDTQLSQPTYAATMVETLTDEQVLSVLPSAVQQQLLPVLLAHPEVAQALHASARADSSQMASLVKNASSNHTLLMKLWTFVLYYRVGRLYASLLFYSQFQSKIMLWRVMTWGIRVLTWVKVGILLGFVEPQVPPTTPEVVFTQDWTNRTLTVTAVNAQTILWSNIDMIGSGACNPLPTGNVTIGQQITNCSGTIVLRYLPTDTILYVADFSS